ncbi:MAG: hypothetical protein E4H14_18595 [Candidatus Thorarchaeota archaeon]|nr:MAG: hypothetical protein E4H14_18595 [Candidatus Thorarchaeota archaeon]
MMNDDYYEQERRKERARMYFVNVAELNQLIVRDFSPLTDGFSVDDVVQRFPEYPLQLIKDALDSAVEDEYFEVKTKDDGSLWYTPIIFDEYD